MTIHFLCSYEVRVFHHSWYRVAMLIWVLKNAEKPLHHCYIMLHHSAPLSLQFVLVFFVYLKQVPATGHFVLDIVAVALVTLAVVSASLLLFFLLLCCPPSELDHASTGLAGPTWACRTKMGNHSRLRAWLVCLCSPIFGCKESSKCLAMPSCG